MILTRILEKNATAYANRSALTMKIGYRTKTLTYQQVYELSKKIAVFLEKNGIGKGDKVLICAPNSPYWVSVFWATLLRGAIVVPLNIQSTKQIIEKIAEQTQAKILFKHIFFKHELSEHIKLFDLEFINDLIEGISLSEFKPVIVDENDLFQIMYTSGTTGDPKGVMLSHKNVYSNVDTVSEMIMIKSQKDRTLSILPLSHIFEQTVGFLLPYYSGVEIVYAHSYGAIRSLMKKYKITKIVAVPEFLQIIMSRIDAQIKATNKEKLFDTLFSLSKKINNKFISRILFYPISKSLGGKLDTIASGGAPLALSLAEKWEIIGVNILQGYGLTETSPIVSLNTYEQKHLGSVGKILPGVQVKLAQNNEILVKGPNVFVGYYKDEQKTKNTFTDDGWFKTGDIGEFDKDGFLFIKGRIKYLIKGPGGQNVYPEDIEEELNKFPGIMDSCVLGIEKQSGAVEIHAVLLLDPKQNINPEEVIAKANNELASYQQITGWSIWHDIDFPRTVTRKIKKEEVRKYLESNQKEDFKIEHQKKSKLIQILSQITGVDASKINDSTKIVPQLNMDSLMRVELIAWIEEGFSVVIDETSIGSNTTVEQLEKIINEKKPITEQPQLKKWPRSKWIIPFRFLGQQIFFALIKPFVKLKVEGLENLKNIKDPVIYMPNHISFLDSLIVAKSLPWQKRNKLSFAAARDVLYVYYKFLASFIEFLFNSFPIQRQEGENIKLGLDYIGQMLDKGFSVVLFPEGKMSENGQMLPLKKGAGLIAVEMEVLIVPVKIIGTSHIVPYGKIFPRRRGEVVVKFGKPIKFKRSDSFTQATEEIALAMKKL